jgi:formylglycine-generating enzyme required for sulfatase activity
MHHEKVKNAKRTNADSALHHNRSAAVSTDVFPCAPPPTTYHPPPKIKMMRLLPTLLAACCSLAAQDTRNAPQGGQIPGPANQSDFAAWLADIKHWRTERLSRIGYSGSEYDRPELKWTQRSFVQPQMMVEDRNFFDTLGARYMVDRYLDDLARRYGGIDSVLIWSVYPNIGIDNRNQFDLLHDLPGGVEDLKRMVADFHNRGVRVLFPVMAWDTGTNNYGSLADAATKFFGEIGADGINGDTMDFVPRTFRAASDKARHPLALEPENGADKDEGVEWNNMSWGYWKYGFIPTVSRWKWIEPRHMVHVCRRWARDHTDDLQFAFFNGVGFESWENIWGIWNGLTPRDAEALRRIAKIERQFADLLIGPNWEPHTPVLQYGIFASKFPGANETLWTFINRNEYDVTGRQIRIPHFNDTHYFDLWHGVELKPQIEKDTAVLSFAVDGHGYGAVLATNHPDDLRKFMYEMGALARFSSRTFTGDWRVTNQRIVPNPPTEKPAAVPAGMIQIPAGNFEFRVAGIEIEGSNDVGVDVQYPWENEPRRFHREVMQMKSFYIDKYPVTNADFKKFLDATQYKPRDAHNFLKHWVNGAFPPSAASKPVIWVSIEDARAYAKWAAKRLPHEWEWQYAAQGDDGRMYPWGNEWLAVAVPTPHKDRTPGEPADVNAHPAGASPFGVMDMVGNIWQWTDEFEDEHTRAAILRGGSYYQPQGSHWYFPQAYKLDEHGKYLLMAPSKDRAGTLGFRCVADAE